MGTIGADFKLGDTGYKKWPVAYDALLTEVLALLRDMGYDVDHWDPAELAPDDLIRDVRDRLAACTLEGEDDEEALYGHAGYAEAGAL